MPELPEVESFRRLLLPLICSQKLTLELMKENPPKKFLSQEDITQLSGKCFVKDVLRKGKLIAVVLGCQRKIRNQTTLYLFVHMGMTGRISTPDHVPVLESLSESEYPPPYSYLRFKTDQAEASFSDPRKFGFTSLGTTLEEGFGPLAPDALTVESADGLVGKSTGIKALLLDQKRVMSGIGNWVADEVLYQCEIHPEQNYLNEEQASRILQKLRNILATAIDLYGENETLPSDWLFHVRWGKRAFSKGDAIKDCQGRKVVFLTAAGRTSAVVPTIQKLKTQKPVKSTAVANKKTAETEMLSDKKRPVCVDTVADEMISGASKKTKSKKTTHKKANSDHKKEIL
jgi:formamidopyrimidine-DNA glycosylase